MNNHKKLLAMYEEAMQWLAEELCDKYGRSKDIDILGDDNVWLWPISIHSYVVSLDQIICALVNNIPKEIFIAYYDYCSDQYWEKKNIEYNLYNYYLKHRCNRC
jgi:hypothetical protein